MGPGRVGGSRGRRRDVDYRKYPQRPSLHPAEPLTGNIDTVWYARDRVERGGFGRSVASEANGN
jgi:hypothetical protein